MTAAPLKILVVDDNPGDRRLVEAELAFQGGGDRYVLHGAATLAEALAAVSSHDFNVAILDMGLPDSQGLDTVERFIAAAPDLPVVVLTGLDDRAVGIAAVRAGAQDYLVKGDVRGDLLERSLMHALERKQIEEKLRDSESRVRGILEDSPVGVALSREDGSILFLNRRLAEMHCVDYEAFSSQPAQTFFANPADRTQLVAAARAGKPLRDVEIQFRRANGTFYWALVTMVETRHEDESVLLTWIYDISARKAAEEAQRAATEQAERAARSRAEFLAMMSHEIRTPMTGVLGMVRLLLHSDLTPEQRDCAETIAYSGDALMTILDDVLDLTRLDAGRLELDRQDFDPRRVVHSVVHLMASRATEKGLRLDTDFAADVPDQFCGDAARLRQVLLNLIGNAIKFTDLGGITVSVTAEQDDATVLRVEVRDTGPGIDAERREALFEPFVQADPSVATRHGGSGLGLSICRRLVALMGGTIGVDSMPGRGSGFWFTLPSWDRRRETRAPTLDAVGRDISPVATAINAPMSRMSILLAEDNPINQKVVAGYLSHSGHQVTLAANGREAVDLAAGGGFDVVLMDVHMPVLDGLKATQAIRALGGVVGAVPILALTADVFPEDVERCRRAGMNGHLPKPIQPELVAAALERVRDGGIAAPAPIAPQSLQLLNRGAVESLIRELDLGFLVSLLASFQAEARRDIDLLAEPRAVLTDPVLRRRAHDLKATAGNFGLAMLSGAAEQVEYLSREGRLEDARAAARLLPAVFDESLSTLGKAFPVLRIHLPETPTVG
ncbi:MAG: response regulator [Rhodospirillaceae bacterium]